MLGSDDYFTEDFVLDDHALAILDEEEHKYLLSQSKGVGERSDGIQASKRQRTDSGWKSPPPLFEAELEALHLQLEEVRQARLAKEGEVAVLRRGIEKTARDHAAQVAKLKAAKEESDAKQALLRKELKDEMERLRTQFTFKQHEMEASRRAPWPGRTPKGVPPTPVPIAAQMRASANLTNGNEQVRRSLCLFPQAHSFVLTVFPNTAGAQNILMCPDLFSKSGHGFVTEHITYISHRRILRCLIAHSRSSGCWFCG